MSEPLQGVAIAVVSLAGFGVFIQKFGLRGFVSKSDDA